MGTRRPETNPENLFYAFHFRRFNYTTPDFIESDSVEKRQTMKIAPRTIRQHTIPTFTEDKITEIFRNATHIQPVFPSKRKTPMTRSKNSNALSQKTRQKKKTNRRSARTERRNNFLSCLSTEMLLIFIVIV